MNSRFRAETVQQRSRRDAYDAAKAKNARLTLRQHFPSQIASSRSDRHCEERFCGTINLMTTCLIALGSNLGDREANLGGAIKELCAIAGTVVMRQSRFYPTQPVGGPVGQGEFLNGAVVIETTLEPLPLLRELQRIEAEFGRQRAERWGPRTLDLDLLLYGDAQIETPDLVVPHPRMAARRFVLEPSAEIAGEMVDPSSGHTIEKLLRDLIEREAALGS